MRIPDDIEDLVLPLVEPGKKRNLMRMSRDEINELIMGEIGNVLALGYVEKSNNSAGFPYNVTEKGREILKILAPCKRSGK
jgi:hypothetical protein